MDVVVAATVTMLIVVSMLSLGGAIGTSVGYDTAITNPTGYYVGGLAGGPTGPERDAVQAEQRFDRGRTRDR